MKLSLTLAALLAALFVNSPTNAAGLSRSENFLVLAPDQKLADELLKAAEKYRREVAVQWLGAPLPPSVGPAIINLQILPANDRGITWAIDSPERKYHRIWLEASRERALGAILKHEITHVVFATRFPSRLPTWLEEGCASFADDAGRQRRRQGILNWYARTNNWPSLQPVLKAETMAASDQAGYAIAASLTEFLLTRRDRATLLSFAESINAKGLDKALADFYDLGDAEQLTDEWKSWYVAQNVVARGGAERTR